jgi:uncharacterized protein (DUF1015 family)
MHISPFPCWRPTPEAAAGFQSLPYDVYDRAEAAEQVKKRPKSFLAIDRPETAFGPDQDMYAPEVYAKAAELLHERMTDGTLEHDAQPCFYLYRLVMGEHAQTGIVCACDVDDYEQGVIKRHENTRAEKERDRIEHIKALGAQTGPIFLTYRDDDQVKALVDGQMQQTPLYDFTDDEDVRQTVWRIGDAAAVAGLQKAFEAVPCAYIADGHHRAASAVKVAQQMRAAHPEDDGTAAYNRFLSVLFPAGELEILPYNRVVHDLNGLTVDEFLGRITQVFEIEHVQPGTLEPIDRGAVAMYLDKKWYGLGLNEDLRGEGPVDSLDVAVLQDRVLQPILGIDDPRSDPRIEFVGGIRGVEGLARKVDAIDDAGKGPAVAFALFATSIQELLAVADAGKLMPPKSTWFEPKLRSGLFIRMLDDKE